MTERLSKDEEWLVKPRSSASGEVSEGGWALQALCEPRLATERDAIRCVEYTFCATYHSKLFLCTKLLRSFGTL